VTGSGFRPHTRRECSISPPSAGGVLRGPVGFFYALVVLTGHCLCGGVRFEITEPLVSASYCHCTRCQRRTGTGSGISARVAPGSVRFVEGAELIREWRPPEDGHVKAFCSVCGGHLYSRDPDDPAVMAVRMGAIDGDPGIRPQYRHHVATAVSWEPILDGLPQYPDSPP
jgi:hypothetical protein